MSDTTVTITGNVTRDPELRYTQGGRGVANFTIACNKRIKNPQTEQWEDGPTTYIKVVAWQQLGENAAASLHKGDRVCVTGTIENREYDKDDGTKGHSLEITADDVCPSLKWATAQLERTNRAQGRSGPESGNLADGGPF